jgi:hypothetical protein
MTRRDYHEPACYDRMNRLASVLIDINDPDECFVVMTCSDSRSSDQLAVLAPWIARRWHSRLMTFVVLYLDRSPPIGRRGSQSSGLYTGHHLGLFVNLSHNIFLIIFIFNRS